jgi:HK97 family phage major capsid protein
VPYNNVISRTDVQALIPEEVSLQMLNNLNTQSALLELSARVPVARNQTRFPVLAALPTAYFVNGDTGLKQTTEVNWANKFMNVEEVAAIVPIPEAVLDDTSYDVWGTVRPLMEQAIGRTVDAAAFFNVNKPASWPTAIVPAAAAVSPANTVTRGTATQANGGISRDFSDLFATVEADGYDVNGVVGRTTLKALLRNARDTTGQLLADLNGRTIWGQPLRFAMPGMWPTPATGAAEAIVGDWTQSVVGVRQDFTYKILDQAVIQDNTGAIQYNLAQQDMVAMRVVFRVAWQVANTINYEQPNEASRYPFGVLLQP